MKNQQNTPVFHLGFTMAGAVSAGAYTAGFMDYILENLNEWEKRKQNNRKLGKDHKNYDHRIPMHDVCIDALGGASAGGMVSMITALSFFHTDMKPVKEKTYTKTGNILYDSWVFLDDDLKGNEKDRKITFAKMLEHSDLSVKDGVPSLLNSKPIDAIAEGVFDNLPKGVSVEKFPNYISKDLRVLLTLTSLTPINYTVNFSKIKSAFLDTTPGHTIGNHSVVGHFKLNFNPSEDTNKYLPFNPYKKKTKDFLIKITKATGAFPIGLAPRHFKDEFNSEYLNNSLSRTISFQKNMDVTFNVGNKDFQFTGVDGGTLNNEPFDEVIRTLQSKHGPINAAAPSYGTVMIDPFPNFEGNKHEHTTHQKDIFSIVGKLVGTIMNQARNKTTETYDIGFFKLLAFPIKWKSKGILEQEALACGGLGGFGGFFDIEFRMHDFFLGRDNARNFLRRYLCLEYNEDKKHPLFENISAEALAIFKTKYKDPQSKEKKLYLPILPDISYIEAKETGDTNPYNYTVPDFPKLNRKSLEALEKPIKERVKKIVKIEIDKYLDGFFLKNTAKLFSGLLSKKITNWVMIQIENDFKSRGM
jgi:hypothetical protein